MPINYTKAVIYPALLAGLLVSAGCSSTETPEASATAPAVSTMPTTAPSAAPSAPASAAPSAAPSATPSTVPSTSAPAATAAPSGTPAPAASSGASVSAASIKAMLELAKSGKAEGIAFAAKTNLTEDVEKAWGKADTSEFAGSGIYATYSKKHAAIGYNKGSQIIDIRSYDPKLQTITLSQIEQALGKPADTKVNGSDTIYIYKASDEFQLKFVIPQSTGKVDHISVFDTIHSVNNMAG
ncbi:YjgB family protein [Paenibacillus oryzisoli]|uniref:YjgB family protein n=1 Tax=Paenibacillus oryzisoli TaxID=1850517 RepID=UPI003D2A7A1B